HRADHSGRPVMSGQEDAQERTDPGLHIGHEEIERFEGASPPNLGTHMSEVSSRPLTRVKGKCLLGKESFGAAHEPRSFATGALPRPRISSRADRSPPCPNVASSRQPRNLTVYAPLQKRGAAKGWEA